MSREPKKIEGDDGRRIADMSGVTRPNLWSFRFPSSAPWYKNNGGEKAEQLAEPGGVTYPPTYDPNKQLTPTERRSYILAAVGAGLGIAAVFGVVFAIFILIIGHVHCA